MTYEVRLQPLAETDLEQAYLWAVQQAPKTAKNWLNRFQAALETLSLHPERCGLAPEHKSSNAIYANFCTAGSQTSSARSF